NEAVGALSEREPRRRAMDRINRIFSCRKGDRSPVGAASCRDTSMTKGEEWTGPTGFQTKPVGALSEREPRRRAMDRVNRISQDSQDHFLAGKAIEALWERHPAAIYTLYI